jgi:hypothetical protein
MALVAPEENCANINFAFMATATVGMWPSRIVPQRNYASCERMTKISKDGALCFFPRCGLLSATNFAAGKNNAPRR